MFSSWKQLADEQTKAISKTKFAKLSNLALCVCNTQRNVFSNRWLMGYELSVSQFPAKQNKNLCCSPCILCRYSFFWGWNLKSALERLVEKFKVRSFYISKTCTSSAINIFSSWHWRCYHVSFIIKILNLILNFEFEMFLIFDIVILSLMPFKF